MSWLKSILDLIAQFLGLLQANTAKQTEDKRVEQAQAVQKSTQQEQVIENAKVAQEVRADVERAVAADPTGGVLWTDDGFERR